MEAVRIHRWTRREYERMGEAGVLAPDARTELIDGEVIEMSPQGSRHATAVRRADETLSAIFGEGFDVRPQLPLALSEADEPEPDLAVVRGHFDDYADAHPSEAVLVVEVSNATLTFDRTTKLALYARHGMPEYWIVNLVDDVVEVYRDPAGATYRTKTTLLRDDQTAPAERPQASVRAADLLP